MDQHREHPRRDDEFARRGLRDDVRDGEGHLVLHAENVDVHTERVAAGRVTLRKQVVTEEVTVPVTVRHERLEVVEEAFDDTDATTTDAAVGHGAPRADRTEGQVPGAARTDVRHLDDGDIEITLYAERPVVTVEVVPVERVRVRRGVVTETRQVEVDVAHEEAYMDRDGVAAPHDANLRDRH